METNLIFYVNGKKVVEKNADPEWTLLYYLRNKLSLCGTKLGCGEGGCGACTVMVSKYDKKNEQLQHLAINACLAPVCSMHGLAVTTVEGIGSTKTKLHSVQETIANSHGTQCGFCTPGIVMSMYALLRSSPNPSIDDLMTTFQGNLCRCTGYRPIIEGFKKFVKIQHDVTTNGNQPICSMGKNCCKNLQNGCNGATDDSYETTSDYIPYDASQEPIFPPELKLNHTLSDQNLVFKGSDVTWYRPTTLQKLLELKEAHPDSKLIGGNTEVGIEMKFKNLIYPTLIQTTSIFELTNVEVLKTGLKLGASVTLENLENVLKKQINSEPEHKTRIFVAITKMLQLFAGKQIRNVATIGGNIMTGSPISDLNPIFMSAQVELELQSKTNGIRKIIMDDNFFVGYRKTTVHSEEVLVSITIPHTNENQHVFAYKQSKRRDDDIAIVNSAINVFFEPNTNIVKDIILSYGGMAETTVRSPNIKKLLVGKLWNEETLEHAYQCLLNDFQLPPSAPGGMVQFRQSLTLSFFFKAYLSILSKLETIKPADKSAITEFQSLTPRGSQYYNISKENEKLHVVGKPMTHISGIKHATGEAVYCDDIPKYSNELYMAFVLSTKAHANILDIDTSEAFKIPGVIDFLSERDLPENKNQIGTTPDELLFYSKTVTSQGQIVGVIIAEDQLIAQKAARRVKITYQELHPIIISIEDAIKHNSFFSAIPNPKELIKGDVDEVFRNCSNVVEGDFRTGNQEHFYLETQCSLVVPKNEDNEMEVFCSTQYPTAIAQFVAKYLDIPQNRVNVRVKRVGGGFGGKEHRPAIIAVPAALAASKYGRPVRCMLNRDEDMQITGGRNAFSIKYKVAFDDNGKMLASDIVLYANAGYANDLSEWVMERAMLHFENSYYIPKVRVRGYVCKTNLPSNMAFRGFGAPQGMLTGEFMIRAIAEYLHKDPVDVGRLNLYREGDLTPYNQKLDHCTLLRCWDECLESSKMSERKQGVEKYNRYNRWKKRGISLVATKFGIAFSTIAMNQAAALIHVYTDGSVLLTHAGVEIGQGLHTKMIQVASTVLEIPTTKILISETSTHTVPNTSPTAASISSDLNGVAVMNACEIIKQRLQPYKEANPKGKWENWVLAAYTDRVSLSTTGFAKNSFSGYDFATHTGKCYLYYTFGVACSEVEIDCLTGDHQVLRTDIVMDVGESLNPAIDVGQIEGAFAQGYGLYMLEEMMFSSDGSILTRGPGTYKLPGFSNVPNEFNVSLLKGAPNPRAIYSSKAVGEPPLFLASSVLFAVREAIKAARADAGIIKEFKLHAPVTPAKIRMACEDHLTAKLTQLPEEGTFIPWNVVP